MKARAPAEPFRIDITLEPGDLEQLWERFDPEQDEIPAVGRVPSSRRTPSRTTPSTGTTSAR